MKYFSFFLILTSFFLKGQPQGYVAKFLFNSGTQLDDISGRLAKTVSTIYVDDRFGNQKSACFLHGSPGSYINLGTNPELKPEKGSISLWINIEAGVESGRGHTMNPIILTKNTYLNKENKNDDFFEAYALYYDFKSHKICIVSSLSEELQVSIRSDNMLSLRTWHHLVMTYDSDSLHLYVDGQLSSKIIKKFKTVFSKTDSVMIGNTANFKNERYLCGAVDDIIIYNRVLSTNEVGELYGAPDPSRFSIYLTWLKWLVSFLLISVGIVWLIVRRQKLKFEKEKKATRLIADYKLTALKAQVKPHFISNCLSSIQNLIYSDNIDKAGEYIAKFSFFLRQVLEYSDKHFLSLNEEVETIKLYVELEKLRFKNNFNFTLEIEKGIPLSDILIPSLVTQSFIENAIWHGLLPLKEKIPTLNIRIRLKNELICITIEDNGVGRKKVETLARKNSMGIKLATDKIEGINQLVNNNDNKLEIIDLFDENKKPSGTKVIIQLRRYSLDE